MSGSVLLCSNKNLRISLPHLYNTKFLLETDTFIYQCTLRYSVLVLMYLELQDIFSLMFQLIKTKKSHLNIVILSLMAFHGLPNLNLIPRPLIDQAEGKIWSNPTLYP